MLVTAQNFELKQKMKYYEKMKTKGNKNITERPSTAKASGSIKTEKQFFNCRGTGHVTLECRKKSLVTSDSIARIMGTLHMCVLKRKIEKKSTSYQYRQTTN